MYVVIIKILAISRRRNSRRRGKHQVTYAGRDMKNVYCPVLSLFSSTDSKNPNSNPFKNPESKI